MIETNKVYCMDAFELLKQLPDKSVDLVLIDPPYNIGKDEWDKIDNYTEWFGNVLKEIERVLKENGSFYFWHNQFPIIAKIQGWIEKNTCFLFKQLLIWDKYNGTEKGHKGANIKFESQRNYAKMAEYCLFYTFQDSDNYFCPELRNYLREERDKSGLSNFECYSLMGHSPKSKPQYFDKRQWSFPTKERYLKLQQKTNFFKKDYTELLKLNDERKYTFNFNGFSSVIQFPPEPPIKHTTPKPLELFKGLISHSSNEGDVVLDCFVGSGTTAVACKKLNRNFICCDNNADYVAIANKRLAQQSVTDFTSATPTLAEPKEFNMGLEVQKSKISSPKSKSQRREWKW